MDIITDNTVDIAIFTCKCGMTMSDQSKYKHMKTKRHYDSLNYQKKISDLEEKNKILQRYMDDTKDMMDFFKRMYLNKKTDVLLE
jgi:hypothetical protein